MSCCTNTIQPFFNEATTTVAYTGVKPTISIAYLQPNGTFLTQGVFSQIDLTPTSFIIDHGGLASGVIKLVQ